MNPVRLAVQRPVLITMFILVFVVIGLFSYQKLAQELMPNVDLPFLTIMTVYPGGGPKEVESQISKVLEDEISAVSNIKRIQSINRESLSFIFIEFELGTDINVAANDVKEKVDVAGMNLPDDAENPIVEKFDISSRPIISLAMFGDRSPAELFQIADNEISDAFSKVTGVSTVNLIGGREREIQVHVSKEKLRAYGLSIMDVVQAIAAENLDVPAGRIVVGPDEFSVRLAAKYESLDQLSRTRILLPTGDSILLHDVGQVIDGLKEKRTAAQYQGKSAIGIEVMKTSGANTVTAANGILAALEDLKKIIPSDIEVVVVEDSSEFILDSVRDVATNILIGILLTSLLLFLFLHDIRATIVVATVMPVSIIATLTLMFGAGFTLNIVSLLALGISIGTLVVNAIVVLENISRHLEFTDDPKEAAVNGTSEVAVAVAASVMTNIVVFTPIAFMKGIIGMFFFQFGLTVVFATIFSLIVSFTLTPMMASRLLRKTGDRKLHGFGRAWEKAFGSLEESYRSTLTWSLKHRWVTIVLTLLVFFGSMQLFKFIGGEFFPEEDQGNIYIGVKLPSGSSLERTQQTLLEVEKVVRAEVPEIQAVQLKVGGSNKGVEDGEVYLDVGDQADRERSVKKITNDVRPKLAAIPAAEINFTTGDHGPGYGMGDLEIEVSGAELDKVNELSKRLADEMRKNEGLVDVRVNFYTGKPEITFRPNREQMARYSLYTGVVAGVIRASYEGEEVSRYKEKGEEYDIRVQLTDAERNDMQGVYDLLIPTPMGQIPITQLGTIEITQAAAEIRRLDKKPMIIVSANIAQGDLSGKVKEVGVAIVDWQLEPGYSIHFGGTAESQAENFGYIFEALFLAIILTYMVLCAIMESYIHPFTIMLTLPLGLVGTALALFLSGVSINMMSMMAIVMLVGIVVNNAILILDYTSQLRDKGKAVVEALIEASVTRLRPIVMTNLAIALAIAPQVMAGSGAGYRRAVAVVTMGGVLVSAIFTLYLIPAIYSAFDRITVKGRQEHREAIAAKGEQEAKV